GCWFSGIYSATKQKTNNQQPTTNNQQPKLVYETLRVEVIYNRFNFFSFLQTIPLNRLYL
ncbi:MAG: hypothetical protein AAFO07_16920, partial [Bacteroidota bacterium]